MSVSVSVSVSMSVYGDEIAFAGLFGRRSLVFVADGARYCK